jgi:uncharacterized protein (TIGR02246 family)
MRRARVALAVAVAFAAGLGSASAQSNDPALDKLAADWSAAFAKGDAKALAGLYTENAVRVTPEGGAVVGREAILKEFTAAMAGAWKGATIKITTGPLSTVAPDVAVGEGTFEVTGARGPDGTPAPPLKGRYLNTVVKKGGVWLLASNAAVPPPCSPPAR